MKKFHLKLFLIVMFTLINSATINAQSIIIDNIYYYLYDNYAEVIPAENDMPYSGDIVIPKVVVHNGVEYPVTSIGHNAFYCNSNLTSITIPNSVMSIGDYAFYGCENLTSLTIPNKVKSIRSSSFEGCSKLENIVVDNNNPIYDSRNDCNGIIETESNTIILGCKNTTIPNSITSIGDRAFCGNSNLTSITIPNSVTSIGNSAFCQCYNLTNVIMSNKTVTIGMYAFNECSKLKSIDIPNSVTSIGNRAFAQCQNLKSITIPNSVTSIEPYAFFGCISATNLTISNNLEYIPERAFCACRGLTSIEIPNSVKSIGMNAFSSCDNVTKITIGNGVNKIGLYAFDGCEKTKILIFGYNVNNIDLWAFNGARIKTLINLSSNPDIVSKLHYNPDKVINAPGGVIKGDFVFYNTSGVNTLIGYFGNDSEICLPKDYHGGSYAVGSHAFDGCYNLASIEIPNNITNIGYRAFEETTWYDNQPNGLMYAGNVLYKYKGKMAEDTEVVIKEGTLGIASGAFNNCLNLKSIIIPNTLKFIGENAFYGCDNIGMIECRAEIPPICETEALDGINKQDCILLVPYKSAYKNVEQWKEFLNINGTIKEIYAITYMVDENKFATDSVAFGTNITLRETPTKEGHTFSGWSEAPETMPAKDIVINGSFTVNSYKVTYMVDGAEFKTVNVNFGEKIELIAAPIKNGFTFSGWSEAPETMPAKDIVINGSFGVNSYKVTYMVDGKEYQSVSLAYGSAITLIDAPIKEGHTFSGWSEAPESMPAKDITISGTFSVNSYKITYKVDGTEYKTVNVNFGEKIELIAAPTKDGFTFSGWTDAPDVMPAKDIVINGSFGVNSYKVTYMVDGKEYQSVSLAYGSAINLIAAPIKNGFTFSGWSEAPETMPAKDIVINGSFGVNSYKVTYMVDGKEYQSVSLAYGSAITLIDAPIKEGHTFSGWSEAPESMPAKDITISGTFSVNSYKITYKVDGTEYKTVNVNFGEKIELIAAPTKDGFTFSGWTDAPDVMPAKDIVINGSFGVNSYKVTYMVDGKEYQSVSLAYGSAINLIDAPTKEGHTFSGWSEAPETMPAKDIVINGSFTVNSYKVTYKVDGAEYKTVDVNFGEKIELIATPIKNGFTFSGWSEAPETMPAKDITISGTFGVNSYKVTYMVDGKEHQSVSLAYGSAITLIEAPTKEGYTFSGWSEAPETMPAKDIVINGSFTVNSYKVTYMVDGANYKTVDVNFGEKIELIAAPTKNGFTFSGWSEAPETMPAKDIVINGTFGVNSYKVIYMVDGKEYQSTTVNYGATITLIEAPTKEGYTFSGWSEAPETMPAKDIVINGSFTVNSYKVTYMVDGANYKTVDVNFGEKIELIAAPTKNGFTFSGWSEAPETMPAKDIVINGTFGVNSYKVIYMVDGKEYQSTTVNYGATITLIEAPTKEGYSFSGWSEAPETMPAKDITISGTFTVNSYKVTYMVDGANYKTVDVNFGEKIELIAAPTKNGFTFSGWSEAPETMPAKDIVINGSFGVNSYKVTYMVDGKEYQSVSLAYGSAITLIDAPTKEGHTFSGWSEAPETMPAKDITINGTFSVNSYKITYMVDGAEFKTVNVNFGEKIELIAAPIKNGFTFSGWSEAPETMPAKDIVINGSFGVNSYKVTYMVDGKEYQSVSLAYGSAITLIDEPTKEGHTFSGWSEAPATMPAKDIVINGSFAVNSYKITYMVDGTEYKTINVNFGEKIVLIDAPAKEGFTFSGWSDAPETMPAKDIVINGKFLTNAYTITYMVDGKEYRTIQVSYGEKIQLIDAPTKEGYTFSGWSETPESMPAKDITISGTFSVNSYKITYMVDGAEYKTVNVNFGEKIVLIDAPAKEGFTFSGWTDAPETMPAKDIVINGKFLTNAYSVTYMVDGKEYRTIQVSYGEKIQLIDAPTKEGYTFSGWSEAPETMPAKDIVINGSFTVNSYKVTYKVDGAEYKIVNVNYGEKIVLIDAPTKDGFTFSGWTDAPDVMPAKDIVINGSFGVNSYKVTYMVDGKEYQSVSFAFGSTITLIDAPTKEGHTFSGWKSEHTTMPAKDITISGTFSVNSYKVTYMVDGANYKTVNVNFGEKIVLIDAPIKNGFTFSGWSEAPETMPAKDIVINGSFAVNSYKVTYMVDGKEYQSVSLAYGSAITLIGAPIKEGHTFSGWSEAPKTMPAKNIVINGSFAVNSYKVTYMVDGTEFKTVNVNFGEKIVLIDAPTKDGFTFSGWTDAPDVMPAKDIVINGKFLTNAYSVTYMVDGKEYRTIQVSYGEKIQLIDAPTKEGYTFSGWSEAPETMPAKDIVINGSFTVNSYKVTYMVDGAEYKTVDVNFGEKIVLIDAPAKDGYTFSGWTDAPDVMPAKDIVINGKFLINAYTITYMVDGKEYRTIQVSYGENIQLIDAPTKEGHTFSGWSEAPKTMPAKDITISGTFSVNYYTLTYIVDGDVYKEEQVAYGSEIVLIDAPTKEDYIFSGWSDYPATMPAENVTITGSFVHTSISGVSADAIVKISGNSITLSGANNNTIVIYTTNGALVEKIDNYAGEEIQLDKGIYIISIDGKVVKIRL